MYRVTLTVFFYILGCPTYVEGLKFCCCAFCEPDL